MSTRNLDTGPLIALLAALALALGLAACSRSDETASRRLAARTPAQLDAASSQAPASQGVPAQGTISAQTPDPAGATDAGDKANSAETAKGTDPPMKSMDKDEESKAMPQPGQANDHSTVAQDPKTPK
jgi:hypothetical protein